MEFNFNRRVVYSALTSALLLLVIFPYQNCATAISKQMANQGPRHSCQVLMNKVMCKGDNSFYQLGLGPQTAKEYATPIEVKLDQKAVSVALSNHSTCALTNEGSVWCWGYSGSLGRYLAANQSFDDKAEPCNSDKLKKCFSKPVGVSGLDNSVTQIAGSADHFCAIKKGEVFCWGEDLLVYDYSTIDVGRKPVVIYSVPDLGIGAKNIALNKGSACTEFETGQIRCFKDHFFSYDTKRHIRDITRTGDAIDLVAMTKKLEDEY